jgi:copper resistance protein B
MAGMDHSGMAGMAGMDHAAMGHAMPTPKPAPAKPKPKRAAAKLAAKPAPRPTKATTAPAAMDHSTMAMPAAPTASGAGMSGMDHSGMDMSGMDHGAMAMPPAQAEPGKADAEMSGMDHSTMDMSGMDHSGMDMSDMDHGAMAMPGMQAPADLPADAAPRTPIPAVTGADRAAAFMPLGAGHPAHDKRSNSFWLVDRLEVADTAKSGGWEGLAWIGGDVHRTWLRTEGDVEDGRVEQGNLEVLYGRSVTPWWDLVAGVRQDVGEGPDRTWAAFGVQGLAPYKFEVEATAYISGSGRTAATLEAEYDTLLTNRLILQWQGEANLYRKSDPARGLGSGLSTVEAGARLRYEITRRFAPYIGVEVERAFGETARLRRDDGFDATDTRVVAGIRFWF